MNLRQLYLTQNDVYKAAVKQRVCGIMVHSTASNNKKLSRYVGPDDGLLGVNPYGNHWNMSNVEAMSRGLGRLQVCVHAFIGLLKDGTVATYQTLPFDMRGAHAGGSANNGYIGFEICEDDTTDPEYFTLVYQEAVEFCAYLCRQHKLRPSSIVCHAEGYQQGIASNHGDVLHWFPKHGKTMDDFRADVAKEMEERMLIEKLIKATGKTEAEVFERLASLIGTANPKEDKWEKDSSKYLQDAGLTSSEHAGNEPVEFGELGAVMKRHLEKHHK